MAQIIMDLLGGPIVQKLLSFIPDPEERQKQAFALQQAMMDAQNKAESDQRDINKVEANSGSMFVAGWRPFIGWVCGAAIAWQFLLKPFVMFTVLCFHVQIPDLPGFDEHLWELMTAMLGIGSMRTVEKIQGVASKGVGSK